ncbi:MAG TPA: SusD/RagB family nutrient-binding outer membrane lipoprotein, partial [Gemmatimonadales bacterium]|nr:SusD/RagB family nutrient-binding outer membrane lipoprotein [Gemmatimonadales bacterium]
ANDLVFPHGATPGEENLWYQFMFVARQGQITAGRVLVDLLKERNDPRLTEFFDPVDGEIIGSDPGERDASPLSRTGRGAAGFDQPQVTYAENQLILAEAQYRLGSAGAALTHLNNARAAVTLPALGGLGGDALLREIALEKYVALFQNIEAWNDYKRLCMPVLKPASGTEVIGRLVYSYNEKNVNPNVPGEGNLVRNDNDPRACQ